MVKPLSLSRTLHCSYFLIESTELSVVFPSAIARESTVILVFYCTPGAPLQLYVVFMRDIKEETWRVRVAVTHVDSVTNDNFRHHFISISKSILLFSCLGVTYSLIASTLHMPLRVGVWY